MHRGLYTVHRHTNLHGHTQTPHTDLIASSPSRLLVSPRGLILDEMSVLMEMGME